MSNTSKDTICRIPDYDHQDLGYSEPFKSKNGNMTRPQLFYRHNKLYIDFIGGVQKIFLPYTGKEKKCFDCDQNIFFLYLYMVRIFFDPLQ
jgi:hypothetical protein